MTHVQPEISTSAPETTTKLIALGRYEVWLWTLAMLLICLLADRGVGGKLFNDSYQYLSMVALDRDWNCLRPDIRRTL